MMGGVRGGEGMSNGMIRLSVVCTLCGYILHTVCLHVRSATDIPRESHTKGLGRALRKVKLAGYCFFF